MMELEKGFYGVTIVCNTGIDPKAPNFRSYASTIKSQGANCFEFSGIVSNGGVQITKDVHAALPTAKILGPDGMCTSSVDEPASRAACRPASTRTSCARSRRWT